MRWYLVTLSDDAGETYFLRFQAEDVCHAAEQAEPYARDDMGQATKLTVEVER